MTIAHAAIYVQPGELDKMVNWYLSVLKPIGYKLHYDLRPQAQGVGIGAMYPEFWLYTDPEYKRPPKEKLHIAFCAKNRQQVRDFHALAMKAGSTDNGGPGLRVEYTRTYYAAYVHDPEGRNIELMCMWPGLLAEPKSYYTIVAAVVLAIGVGVGYFSGYSF